MNYPTGYFNFSLCIEDFFPPLLVLEIENMLSGHLASYSKGISYSYAGIKFQSIFVKNELALLIYGSVISSETET